MFDQYVFSEKADSGNISSDDDEPAQSPESKSSSQNSSPTMATRSLRPSDRRVDSLIQRMNNQALMRNWHAAFASESLNRESDFNLLVDEMSMPMEASSNAADQSAEFDPTANEIIPPTLNNAPTQIQPQRKDRTIEHQPEHSIVMESLSAKAIDDNKPSRQSETRSHDRTQNLISMIEKGEQCNVQVAAPSDSTTASEPTSSAPTRPPIQHTNNINPQLLYEGNTMLEVDMDYCNRGDDDPLLSEMHALREAGVPTGIRKYGFLKYRSSLEAAARCKNMRKCIPRVRKRPKPTTSRPNPTTFSTSTNPTTSTN
ncbi:uncharacterized protein F4822DRAFT_43434 [Hypoxylon trugodes]|uniref:uncharacterized protein n=1 Tax=Hypoxylon trugodes TaxID=326681 RepID=UPI0021991D4B|nr:uncharacterized protein F4822DRAFT_43434 [Hypoxylon trugodes]KAI1394271.1 hypothetical protein F4822DRAFT_43434 [Hypoxylon trugodes]